MSVREDREVAAPPAKTLAGITTAGENRGYTTLDVRPQEKLLLMVSPLSMRGFSLGFIITARVQPQAQGSLLSVDVTPRLGSWALESARDELLDLVREFQAVLAAPKARIRAPQKKNPGSRPFGYKPELLAVLWGLSSLAGYGLLIGGWGWVPAVLGVMGAFMLSSVRVEPWWVRAVSVAAVASLPFGLLGLIARRLATATVYWKNSLEP